MSNVKVNEQTKMQLQRNENALNINQKYILLIRHCIKIVEFEGWTFSCKHQISLANFLLHLCCVCVFNLPRAYNRHTRQNRFQSTCSHASSANTWTNEIKSKMDFEVLNVVLLLFLNTVKKKGWICIVSTVWFTEGIEGLSRRTN